LPACLERAGRVTGVRYNFHGRACKSIRIGVQKLRFGFPPAFTSMSR
jgi:hypothetical protein